MREKFLSDVESFLASNPTVTATELGRQAVKDPNFVFDLREGRSVGLKLVGRMYDWIGTYVPLAENDDMSMEISPAPASPVGANNGEVAESQGQNLTAS